MSVYEINERNRVKRGHKRAVYDEKTVHQILDDTFLCHVGFEVDGQPMVIPTCHWRDGNKLYWHGSSKSMMIRHLSDGKNKACVTVSLLDGLVMARSAFSHSVNYRSAVCFGVPRLVTNRAEFDEQFKFFFDRLGEGRYEQLREMTEQEYKATGLVVMEIEDASAKVRTGPPADPEDADHPIWAGTVPFTTHIGEPVTAPDSAKAAMGHKMTNYTF